MLEFDEAPSSWEAVAACYVAQALGTAVDPGGPFDALYDACDIKGYAASSETRFPLSFSKALRLMGTRPDAYWRVLAETVSGIPVTAHDLKLSTPVSDQGNIVLCPYGPDVSLNLHPTVWKYISKSLRSYKLPVKMMGDPGQRMDSSAFLEDNMLSELPVAEKLVALAGATLVAGVPNAWIWLAAAMGKKVIVLYPDNVPPQRWFWQSSESVLRIQYEHDKVAVPMLLTGVRQAIAAL